MDALLSLMPEVIGWIFLLGAYVAREIGEDIRSGQIETVNVFQKKRYAVHFLIGLEILIGLKFIGALP